MPDTAALSSTRFSLTPEQVKFYHDEGYLVLDEMLTDPELQPICDALTRKVDMIAQQLIDCGEITDPLKDLPFEERLARLFDKGSNDSWLRFGRSWRERDPGYYEMMITSKILDVVEDLLGPEIFASAVFNSRPKVPRVAGGAVPWHQDRSYFPDADTSPVLTCWVALVDCNDFNGCLRIRPRTHKLHTVTHVDEHHTGAGYTEIPEEVVNQYGTETVILPVKKGSMIVFNERCFHMSTENKSDKVRWSLDLRYQNETQDRMYHAGAGFLARSRKTPERVSTLEDWLQNIPEHGGPTVEQILAELDPIAEKARRDEIRKRTANEALADRRSAGLKGAAKEAVTA